MNIMEMKQYDFYTDGACNQDKIGGWSFYCPRLKLRVCGKKEDTTNNAMELLAIDKVLKYVTRAMSDDIKINIHSDSAWAIGALTKEWNLTSHKEKVEEMKRTIAVLKEQRNIEVVFTKVAGHSGIEENEMCDQLAVIMSNN